MVWLALKAGEKAESLPTNKTLLVGLSELHPTIQQRLGQHFVDSLGGFLYT